MPANAPSLLAPWSPFFVTVGSSSAALIGLMFVVITLVTGVERARRSQDGLATFSTPTVLHFCGALLVSAILNVPWGALVYPGALIAMAGLYGVIYVVRVMLRTRRLTVYVPDLEDWAWYSGLPLLAYGAIFAGGTALPVVPAAALFALAGGVLVLIFIGIRNAWDVVTFLAIGGPNEPPE
jgi:hypothetical protein